MSLTLPLPFPRKEQRIKIEKRFQAIDKSFLWVIIHLLDKLVNLDRDADR